MSHAFIFPGQGAQQIGMGKEFYEEGNWVDDIWKEANNILGFDLKSKVFEGTEEDLKQTAVTQPAIFITEIIIYKAVAEKNIIPIAVAGHSLGEYAAIVASGALDWRQGLELVKARGEIFEEVSSRNPGGMIAVIGMDEEALSEILGSINGVAEAANYNSPGQIVVSVEKGLMEEAAARIKEGGAKLVIPLKVSGGFHSALLNDAVEPMKSKIDNMNFKDPQINFYANYTGEKVSDAEGIKHVLVKQITSPVRWASIIENMVKEQGTPEFLEIGPGKVLQGLLKKIDRSLNFKGISVPSDI
jgi:[acyl-carrier-protein] S-malonyltransferase